MEPSTANSEFAEVRPATQDGISIGLGVFAKTDLVNGKEILVLDDPPIALLEEKQLRTICSACFDTSEGGSIDIRKTWLVKACVRCKVVYYCDKNCQRKDWKAGHAVECPVYAKLYPRILPLPVRAILRLLLSYKKHKITKDMWKEIENLSFPNIYDGQSQEAQDHALMTKAVMEYGNLQDMDPGYVQRLFGRLSANSFTLTSAFGRRRGVYFHPGAARFNHSCDPNASYSFSSGKFYVKAIRPIAKDEQIFIPYVDITYSVDTRRHELKERYDFICRCSKCLHEINTIAPGEIKRRGQLERKINAEIDDVLKFVAVPPEDTKNVDKIKRLTDMLIDLQKKSGQDAVVKQQQPIAALRTELMLAKVQREVYMFSVVDAAVRHLLFDPVHYPDEGHPMRREHAYEFVYHLLYADKLLEMGQRIPPEERDRIDTLDTHGINPKFYAWMVLNWMLVGNVTGRFPANIEAQTRQMNEIVYPNPVLYTRARDTYLEITSDLERVGLLGKDDPFERIVDQATRMKRLVDRVLEKNL